MLQPEAAFYWRVAWQWHGSTVVPKPVGGKSCRAKQCLRNYVLSSLDWECFGPVFIATAGYLSLECPKNNRNSQVIRKMLSKAAAPEKDLTLGSHFLGTFENT